MREITIHIKDSIFEHLNSRASTTPECMAAAMLELMVDDMVATEAAASEEMH